MSARKRAPKAQPKSLQWLVGPTDRKSTPPPPKVEPTPMSACEVDSRINEAFLHLRLLEAALVGRLHDDHVPFTEAVGRAIEEIDGVIVDIIHRGVTRTRTEAA